MNESFSFPLFKSFSKAGAGGEDSEDAKAQPGFGHGGEMNRESVLIAEDREAAAGQIVFEAGGIDGDGRRIEIADAAGGVKDAPVEVVAGIKIIGQHVHAGEGDGESAVARERGVEIQPAVDVPGIPADSCSSQR